MKELTATELGAQLRCPSGPMAQQIGDNMYRSNSNMIRTTIDILHPGKSASVLEIGMGSAKHVPYLFAKAGNLQYHGVDISAEMVSQASNNNAGLVASAAAHFQSVEDTGTLPFHDQSFDDCFTVNTIYFWADPVHHLREIYRVLQPQGRLAITFIEKDFAEKQAFTQIDFVHFTTQQIYVLLQDAGFMAISIVRQEEETVTKDGKEVKRPFVVVTAHR